MTISVQPVDGLINRLLQQNSRSASVPDRHHPARQGQDQVSISAGAHVQHQTGKSSGQEKPLESHLLKLYKMNDLSGA